MDKYFSHSHIMAVLAGVFIGGIVFGGWFMEMQVVPDNRSWMLYEVTDRMTYLPDARLLERWEEGDQVNFEVVRVVQSEGIAPTESPGPGPR